MKEEIDWTQILIECKNAVRGIVQHLLGTVGRVQPDLGVGAGGDPLRRIDMAAETAIVDTLKARGVSFTLISEESGIKQVGANPDWCYVTTDPVDGSTNLFRKIPFYATSIAISTEPTLSAVHSALVADLFRGATYIAVKSQGSRVNNARISPANTTSLEEAVIGVDLNSYKLRRIVDRLTVLLEKTKHIRHFGANALELCYVAEGRTDAFVDIRGKLRATDLAAAALIIREAGAIITSPDGQPINARLDPREKVDFVASGNREIHASILNLIKPGNGLE